MKKDLYIEIPQTEENFELFRTRIDWEKEEEKLKKEEEKLKKEKKHPN